MYCLLFSLSFFQRPNQRSCCFHFSFDIRLCNGYRSFRSFTTFGFQFYHLLFVSTIGVSTHIFSTIFSHQLPLLSTPGLYRAIYIITSNLISSIVIFSASKIRKDIFGLSWPVMFVFLVMSVSILISEECLYQLQIRTHFSSYIFSIGYLGLLICSILSILLFHFMAESTNQENQYKTGLNAIRLSQENIKRNLLAYIMIS